MSSRRGGAARLRLTFRLENDRAAAYTGVRDRFVQGVRGQLVVLRAMPARHAGAEASPARPSHRQQIRLHVRGMRKSGRRQDRQRYVGFLQDGAPSGASRQFAATRLRRGRGEPAETEEPGRSMSPMDRALRYLGLSGMSGGSPPDSLETPLPRAVEPREGGVLGARLSFRGEVSGEGD